MVDNNTRNIYFNSFLKESLRFLKEGFGVVMSFYGYPEGVVIKIEMRRSVAHHVEQRQDSNNLSDALQKTSLLKREDCEALRDRIVDTTLISIVSIRCYVLIKSDKESEWTNDAAIKDFSKIITKVKNKYGK